MDKDVVHFGMGFSTGVTTGVLLTLGTIGFVGWRGMKSVGGAMAAVAKYGAEKEPHLASVTPLHGEDDIQDEFKPYLDEALKDPEFKAAYENCCPHCGDEITFVNDTWLHVDSRDVRCADMITGKANYDDSIVD